MEKQTRFNLTYVIFAVLAVLLLRNFWEQTRTVEVVPYSEFEELLVWCPRNNW